MTEIATQLERLQSDPDQVIEGSGLVAVANTVAQVPESSYEQDYQPKFPDKDTLNDSLEVLASIEGVATPEDILRKRDTYADIVTGDSDAIVIVTGPCAERISLDLSAEEIARRYSALGSVVRESLPGLDIEHEIRRPSGKPRSAELEELPSGETIPSYYGDLINDIDPNNRTPDPTRMITAAQQSLELKKLLGHSFSSTHEALLLPYEESFMVTDNEGRKFLTSCVVPWIGVRTNDPDGPHVEMLSGIENPVGVKIGPDDDPEIIARLVEKLNPEREPGKLIFTLRFGTDNLIKAPAILQAIQESAPESLILSDPKHGNTVKTPTGNKTREIPRVIGEVMTLSLMCQSESYGLDLRLHGLHLEASGRNDREECVDGYKKEPRDKSIVDPESNNRQLARILRETKDYLIR